MNVRMFKITSHSRKWKKKKCWNAGTGYCITHTCLVRSYFYLLSSFGTCSYIIFFCQLLVLLWVFIFWFIIYQLFPSSPIWTVVVPSWSQASTTIFCFWLLAHGTNHLYIPSSNHPSFHPVFSVNHEPPTQKMGAYKYADS